MVRHEARSLRTDITRSIGVLLTVLLASAGPSSDVWARPSFETAPAIAATYIGGVGAEQIMDLAVFPSGDIVVVGYSNSGLLPIGDGTTYRNQGGRDGFVMRLSADLATLVSFVPLAGSGQDRALSVEIAPDGSAVVAGFTDSADFPVSPDAYDGALDGIRDGFVAVVDTEAGVPDEERLVYSTLLGGAGEDGCVDLRVSEDDRGTIASVVGFTGSVDFPTTAGAFQEDYQGGRFDTFLAQLRVGVLGERQERLVYSSFLGGSDADAFPGNNDDPDGLFARMLFQDMEIDASGLVTMVNVTNSSDFPVTPGALQTAHRGGRDVYIAQLRPDHELGAAQLVYSTFLGGGGANDGPQDVALDAAGNIVVGGWTWNSGLPTSPDAVDRSFGGQNDAFVTVIRPDLELPPQEQLVYSTLLGGEGQDYVNSLAVDPAGRIVVTGTTQSSEIPVTPGAISPQHSGVWDSFLVILEMDRASGAYELVYSTYFGGTRGEEWDCSESLTALGDGELLLAGVTDTCWFPEPEAPVFQSDCTPSGQDGFVLKLTFDVEAAVSFRRGDCNDDGTVDISDATCTLNWLFLGGPAPGCLAVADMNTEDSIDITDATYLLNFLFLGGPPLPPPYPDCGASGLASDEALGCLTPPEGCR